MDMTASVQVKGKYCYIVLNYRGEQGERRQKWISTHLLARGHKREAQRMIPQVILRYQHLENSPGEDADMRQLLQAWYQATAPALSPSTAQGYHSILQRHLLPYFSENPVKAAQLNPSLLEDYYQMLVQKGLSPSTIRRHHSNLSAALRWGVRQGWIAHNPASQVVLPHRQPYTVQYYTGEQLRQLFCSVRGTELETPVFLAGMYGLRRSEVLALRWQDVQHGVLSICRSVQEHKGQLVFRTQLKTPASVRALPVMPQVAAYLHQLQKRREQQATQWAQQGIAWDAQHLCLRQDGQLLRPSQLSKRFSSFLVQQHFPPIRFHDLRHSCASLLIAQGCPVKAVQVWLGHSSYRTTADTYAHVSAADHRALADVLQQQMGHIFVTSPFEDKLEGN